LGLAVWIAAFVLLFGGLYALVVWSDEPGPAGDVSTTRMAYTLFVLPQVLSSIVGSAIACRRRAAVGRAARAGAVFAACTCAVTAFGSVLWYMLIAGDRPSGLEFLGWLAVIAAVVLAVDCTLAAFGGYLVGRETQKREHSESPGG
jgi:hypothetical protein